MKLYEKMGIKLDQEGLEKLIGLVCSDIPDEYDCVYNKCKHPSDNQNVCSRCKAERLLAEVPTKKVPRIATINTVEELENAGNIFGETICGKSCNMCKYAHGTTTYECFVKYLSEEIEVPE